MKRSLGSFARLAAGSAVLIVGLLVGPLRPVSTHAQWGNCLDDPKVWLSDGTEVDLTVWIGAPASAIQSVSYTLDAAPGVTVDHVVYTHNSWPFVRTVTVTNTGLEAPGHVQSTVLVTMAGGPVGLTPIFAATVVKHVFMGFAFGFDGQPVTINL